MKLILVEPGVANLGTCRPVDAVGHVANKAPVTNLDMAGLKPTAPFAVGFFLPDFPSSWFYSLWLSQCLKEHVSFVHFFGPPLSWDLHGLWKWQGLPLCQEPFELLDELLDLELELLLLDSRPGLPFFLSGHLLASWPAFLH